MSRIRTMAALAVRDKLPYFQVIVIMEQDAAYYGSTAKLKN